MRIPHQKLYQIMVPHENSWWGAFKWWLLRCNKDCKKFCPSCPYYFRCQEDVEFVKLNEGEKNYVRH